MDRATRRVMFAEMFVELHLIELKSCIKRMTFKVIQIIVPFPVTLEIGPW